MFWSLGRANADAVAVVVLGFLNVKNESSVAHVFEVILVPAGVLHGVSEVLDDPWYRSLAPYQPTGFVEVS